ncbi:MAG: AAA family ATPase [Leptospirales bacterium]|nr:AAA family ATPase [Leptospirales bacterium]
MIKVNLSKMHDFDMVLVSGLPSSGKTYIARNMFMDKGRRRISRKEIRRFVYEMTNFGEKWSEQLFNAVNEHFVKHTERKMIEHLLTNGEKVVIVNSSLTSDSRKVYISIAERMRKTLGVIFIEADIRRCLERNRTSKDPIPENIISRLAAQKTLPDNREKFDSIVILTDSDFDFNDD